jgi:hypothetical protein
MRVRVAVILAALLALAPAEAGAQPSAVIVRVTDGATLVASGSGSILHEAGYVLTCFHVVGHTVGPEVGTLRVPGPVAVLTRSAAGVLTRHEAVVVRGDVRRDLALLRVLRDGPPSSFTPVPLGRAPAVGARVHLTGFPSGEDAPRSLPLRVEAILRDGHGRASWLRLEGAALPGQSGGQVLDAEGRLVGIPVMNEPGAASPAYARAVEQVPPEWLRDMARGELGALRVDGAPELIAGSELAELALGHASPDPDAVEMLMYRVDASASDLVLRTTPALPLVVIDGTPSVTRSALGELTLPRGGVVCVSVLVRGSARRAVRFRLRVERAF